MGIRKREDNLDKDSYVAQADTPSESSVDTGFTKGDVTDRKLFKGKRSKPSDEIQSSSKVSLPKVSLVPSAVADDGLKDVSDVSKQDVSKNIFGKFLNTGKWQCTVCMSHNKLDLEKCASCESPKVSTGSSKDASTEKDIKPGFNPFKLPSVDSAESSSVPSFQFPSSFGLGASDKTSGVSSVSSFKFPGLESNASSGFTFTIPSSSDLKFNTEFSFKTSTEVEDTEPEQKDEVKEQFKNATAVPSGDEDDIVLNSVRGALYEFKDVTRKDESGEEKTTKQYVACGKGDVKFCTYTVDGKTHGRVIIRTDKTLRLVLNAPIYKGLKATPQEDKRSVLFPGLVDGIMHSYLLMTSESVGSETLASYFKQVEELVDA